MADSTGITLPPRMAMAVIPDVELVDAGENWPLITDGRENGTFTADDIAAAIAALDDPSIRSPRIKLGHSAKAAKALGDGVPTWGRVPGMWTRNDGMTLAGHFVGVPVWLAEIMPSAWASRSIEGRRNVVSETGRTHLLVIDAVSLLGDEFPAISTLEEVPAIWAARNLEELPFTLKEPTMPSTAAGRRPTPVAASTTTEDIRRAYYEDLPANSWWWIREIELDPLTLIVDDDDGALWRVPVTVSGSEITFGTPDAVRVEYVPVAAGAATSARRAESAAIVFASRAESREGVANVNAAELRKSLGLAEDASDADVSAKIAELAARPEVKPEATADKPDPSKPVVPTADKPADKPETTPVVKPEVVPTAATPTPGTVVVDAVQWAEVQRQAQEGSVAAGRMRTDERNRFIGDVVKAGRLSRANPELRASLEREWDRDPETARKVAAGLAVVVPTEARGHDEGAELDGDDALYAGLFGAAATSTDKGASA